MISPLENNQNCIQNSLQKKEDSLSYYCMTKVTKQGTILIHVTEEFDNFKIFIILNPIKKRYLILNIMSC